MSDRSWFEIWCRREDVETIKQALGVDYEFEHEDGDRLPSPHRLFSAETCIDTDELVKLAKQGIPFYGQHGSCAGAYESLLFAAWKGDYAECMACEDGFPTVTVERDTREPHPIQLAEARMYWEVYVRAEAEIDGGEV